VPLSTITNKIFKKKRNLFSVVLVHKSFNYDNNDNEPALSAAFGKKIGIRAPSPCIRLFNSKLQPI
jgi:hypothetical protein